LDDVDLAAELADVGVVGVAVEELLGAGFGFEELDGLELAGVGAAIRRREGDGGGAGETKLREAIAVAGEDEKLGVGFGTKFADEEDGCGAEGESGGG
jgi:hypothetical protein